MTLPDGKVLELPDGSSALDAARAIGPRLAEQAVLARVDGEPRDLRLPRARRRRAADPHDPRPRGPGRAVRPAPLGGPPPRGGRAPPPPRRQGGDRAARGERLLLRLRVPGADPRGGPRRRSRRRSRASSPRDAPGSGQRSAATRRAHGSRPRASGTRSSSSTRPTATSRSTPRATSPISAAGRTCRTPSRSRRSSSPASRAPTGAATRRTPS